MKKLLSTTIMVVLLSGAAHAQIAISNLYLIDDWSFTINSMELPSVDAGEEPTEVFRHRASDDRIQLAYNKNDSTAGLSDSISPPIDILSHSAVINLPYYSENLTTLKSIYPDYRASDFSLYDFNEDWKIFSINDPLATQVYNGKYVVTIDTVGTDYTGTSDIVNLLDPSAADENSLRGIIADAWNNITWTPSDPFSGGGIPYDDINDISSIISYANEAPVTTDNGSVALLEAPLMYSISINATDSVAPDAPVGLTASNWPARVHLNWDDNTDADLASYRMYRSATSGSGYVAIATNENKWSWYSDTNVVNDTTYYYVVTAIDLAGNESSDSTEVVGAPTDSVPDAPTGLAVVGNWDQIQLDWDDNANPEEDLASYNVYRSITSGSGYSLVSNRVYSSYTDTNTVNGVTYYYVVTAMDAADQESTPSAEVSSTPIAGPSVVWSENFDSAITLHSDYKAYYTNEHAIGEWTHAQASQVGGELQLKNQASGTSWENGWTQGAGIPLDASLFAASGAGTYWLHLKFTSSTENTDLGVDIWNAQLGSSADNNYYIKNAVYGKVSMSVKTDTGSDATLSLLATNRYAAATDLGTVELEFVYDGDGDVVLLFGAERNTQIQGTVRIDDIQVLKFSTESAYDTWAGSWDVDLGEQTADYDHDSLNNLYEYGLGGNPTNGFVDGEIPTFGPAVGGLEYIHPLRKDDPSLAYSLALTDNLVFGSWVTNSGYTVTGTNVTGGTFDYVINSIPSEDDTTFIKLIIEESP